MALRRLDESLVIDMRCVDVPVLDSEAVVRSELRASHSPSISFKEPPS